MTLSPTLNLSGSAAKRDVAIDALRGFALLGVILANAPWFAGKAQLISSSYASLDLAALATINSVFTNRFFLIFSFLFGFGFTSQESRHPTHSVKFRTRFARRMAVLFGFGLLHATFLFVGDILMLYAVCGGLLWVCRGLQVRTLFVLGAISLAIGVVSQTFGYYLLSGPPGPAAYPGEGFRGSFAEVVGFNLSVFPSDVLPLTLLVNGPFALGMFLLGRSASIAGYFPLRNPLPANTRMFVAASSCVSILLSFIFYSFSFVAPGQESVVAAFLWCAISPVAALTIALTAYNWFLAHENSLLSRMMSATGRQTLTAYVLSSTLLCTIFYGWGLDKYDSLSAIIIFILALGIYTCIIAMCCLWQIQFRIGPLEWIWRSLTQMNRVAFLK
jgi:uncharacterized protein